MTIEHWNERNNLDNLAQSYREFTGPFELLEKRSKELLGQYIEELDRKAGIDPKKFIGSEEGYEIEVQETSFSNLGLPQLVSERVGATKVSLKVKREPGILDLEVKNLATGKVVGFDIHVRMLSQDATEAGVRLMTADGELEENPAGKATYYGILDQNLNDLPFLRLSTTAAVFSHVIDQLLSEDFPVKPFKEERKQFTPVWDVPSE